MKCNDFVVVTDGKDCVLEYYNTFYNPIENRFILVPDSMYSDFMKNYAYKNDLTEIKMMLIRYYYTFDGVIWHDHKFNLEFKTLQEINTIMKEFHKAFDNGTILKAYWTNASGIRTILKGGY